MNHQNHPASMGNLAGTVQPDPPIQKGLDQRKVVASLYISLDGVTEAPDRWQFDHFDAEMMASMASQTAAQDAVLLGRVTYQEWAAYWPTSTAEPFASYINQIRKYVISTTLEKVEWQNSILLEGPLAEEIACLKQQAGKIIGVAGSPTLVRSLLLSNLLDELTLMVHPVVAGRGKRLFPGESELKRLVLVGSCITTTGVAILTYQPRAG